MAYDPPLPPPNLYADEHFSPFFRDEFCDITGTYPYTTIIELGEPFRTGDPMNFLSLRAVLYVEMGVKTT